MKTGSFRIPDRLDAPKTRPPARHPVIEYGWEIPLTCPTAHRASKVQPRLNSISVDTFLDGWYVLLYVPSAVVPGGHSQDWNLLMNPRHPDSGSVVGGKSSALFIDSRLKT